jgi:hypothetical protein
MAMIEMPRGVRVHSNIIAHEFITEQTSAQKVCELFRPFVVVVQRTLRSFWCGASLSFVLSVRGVILVFWCIE